MTTENDGVWREKNETLSNLRNHDKEPNLSTRTLEKDANFARVAYVTASVLTLLIVGALKLLLLYHPVPEPSSITPPVFLFVVALACLLVVLPLAYFFEEHMKSYRAFRCYRYVHYSPVQHRFINIGVWRRVHSATSQKNLLRAKSSGSM